MERFPKRRLNELLKKKKDIWWKSKKCLKRVIDKIID